jgi:hypothetical protein
MSTQIDLKAIEQKAFRSTFQDGLWDIYFGLVVVGMALFIYRPASGYSLVNILLVLLIFSLAYGLFWAGKKYITLPRMGQVQFGAKRKRRKLIMTIVLSVIVLFQVILFVFTLLVWRNPELSAGFKNLLPDKNIMDLIVASIGALMVGPSMILVAYFRDFPRGYYIAVMMALTVFLMLFLNQPVYPIIIGILIALPGFVLFIRFLRKYPLHKEEARHD